jgi:hypothetical protein
MRSLVLLGFIALACFVVAAVAVVAVQIAAVAKRNRFLQRLTKSVPKNKLGYMFYIPFLMAIAFLFSANTQAKPPKTPKTEGAEQVAKQGTEEIVLTDEEKEELEYQEILFGGVTEEMTDADAE